MARWSQLDEDSLMRRIQRFGSRKRGAESSRGLILGIGDDAALFKPRIGYEVLLTCDWFLEGVHFLRNRHPADAVGWKCLARAASDIAAMGGQPRCFLLSLALPPSHVGRWLDEFLGGLRRAERKFSCPLAGGDTTRRAEISINVTVVGEVLSGHAILRSGAKPGDAIFVSGRLGEAELGLRRLTETAFRANRKNPVLRKHLYPEPRLRLGCLLAKKGLAGAMIDLSDGLSTDLSRLCVASHVGARIETDKLPLVSGVPKGLDRIQFGLHGGDDYELLFTVPRSQAGKLPRRYEGLQLTRIGEIIQAKGILLTDSAGRQKQLLARGWDPFRGRN